MRHIRMQSRPVPYSPPGVLADILNGMDTSNQDIFMIALVVLSALAGINMLRILAIYRYKEVEPWNLALRAQAVRRHYFELIQAKKDEARAAEQAESDAKAAKAAERKR